MMSLSATLSNLATGANQLALRPPLLFRLLGKRRERRSSREETLQAGSRLVPGALAPLDLRVGIGWRLRHGGHQHHPNSFGARLPRASIAGCSASASGYALTAVQGLSAAGQVQGSERWPVRSPRARCPLLSTLCLPGRETPKPALATYLVGPRPGPRHGTS